MHALFAAAALALIVAALRLPSISHQAWQPRLAGIHSAILLELSRQAQQDADAGPRAKPLAPRALVQLEAGTPVHGRMRKRGPLPSLVELAAGRSAAELGYRDAWAAQRLAGSKPPFPSKWCAIMFNDKYKLIFLKCPKTAGNTLVSRRPSGAGSMTVPAVVRLFTAHARSLCVHWEPCLRLQPSRRTLPSSATLSPQVGYFGLCIKDQRDTCLAFLDANNATELQRLVDVWQVGCSLKWHGPGSVRLAPSWARLLHCLTPLHSTHLPLADMSSPVAHPCTLAGLLCVWFHPEHLGPGDLPVPLPHALHAQLPAGALGRVLRRPLCLRRCVPQICCGRQLVLSAVARASVCARAAAGALLHHRQQRVGEALWC